MPARYPQPYRGDGRPRRDPDKYVLKESSLSSRIITCIVFAITGAVGGYLIGNFFDWSTGATIFTSALLLIVAVIAYFAKEDLEKVDIHDLDEIQRKDEDDEP